MVNFDDLEDLNWAGDKGASDEGHANPTQGLDVDYFGRPKYIRQYRTPEQKRATARKAQQTRLRNEQARREQNKSTGLLEALHAVSSWNSFAESLLDQHAQGRAWSDKQIEAVKRMLAKVEANRKEKQAKADANAVAVDLSPIMAMFEHASGKGYKRPTYRAMDLVISKAPDTGRNAGSLYIKADDGEYQGKITGGKYYAAREVDAQYITKALQAIAKDPRGEAIKYGQRTGKCSACNRPLTNHDSIDQGIGPICADKMGL